MSNGDVHVCACRVCQQEGEQFTRLLHQQMNLFVSRLDEQQRRWYVALEATRVGVGGDRLLAQITGLDPQTIHVGQQELAASLTTRSAERVRLPGGGRPRAEKKIRS